MRPASYHLPDAVSLDQLRPSSVPSSIQSPRRVPAASPIAWADGSPAARLAERTLVCFSHLRWAFVFQRPQHLLTRLAAQGRVGRVVFIEEAIPSDGPPRVEESIVADGVCVLVPRLAPHECVPGHAGGEARLAALLAAALAARRTPGEPDPVHWYYTPMALRFTRGLPSSLTVYDCMDELSQFRFAPPQLLEHERELLARAELVFTGGRSLYEAKRHRHERVCLFPSSVDRAHFATARSATADPPGLHGVPQPRIGYYGVIDERLDLQLLADVATARPQWQFVMLGPVVKIDPATLPRAANIHYLGARSYDELPAHVGRWDLCMMPFALNEATRFISPTKTPEYLAAGCAVVSTPVADVVRTWGDSGLVRIAADAPGFVAAIADGLREPARSPALCRRADVLLRGLSWDATAGAMADLIAESLDADAADAARAASAQPRASDRSAAVPAHREATRWTA